MIQINGKSSSDWMMSPLSECVKAGYQMLKMAQKLGQGLHVLPEEVYN